MLKELSTKKPRAFFTSSFCYVACQDVLGCVEISMPELLAAFAISAFRATQNMVYLYSPVRSLVESSSMGQQALALVTIAAGSEFVYDAHSGVMML
jgi:hypothetical protein